MARPFLWIGIAAAAGVALAFASQGAPASGGVGAVPVPRPTLPPTIAREIFVTLNGTRMSINFGPLLTITEFAAALPAALQPNTSIARLEALNARDNGWVQAATSLLKSKSWQVLQVGTPLGLSS